MRLLKLRKKKKLTQSELAEKLFMTQNGYSNYERGRTEPDIEVLCKLADFYNVSLDYLVGREYTRDIGYLSEEQKIAVSKLQELDENNLKLVTAYMDGIIDKQ